MSGEIEFLDVEPAPEADGSRTEPTANRSAAWNAWAVLGWTAGAVLAVVAPWQMIYRIAFGSDGTYGADGWGRLHVHERGGSTDGHIGRFGIVLCCAAALMILAAAWVVLEHARSRRGGRVPGERLVSHLGLAATMLGAGAAAAVYLDAHAMVGSLTSPRDPSFAAPTASYGPFLWCCLAAVGCGLAGTIARLLATARPDGASA